MKIQKRLIFLVGIGMLLVISITIFALQDMTSTFSATARESENLFAGIQRLWTMQKDVADMTRAVHNFWETGDTRYRSLYADARARAREAIASITEPGQEQGPLKIVPSLTADLRKLETISERLLSEPIVTEGARLRSRGLMREMDRLIVGMGKDVEQYQEEHAVQMGRLVTMLGRDERRTDALFLLLLIASMLFLSLFGVYLQRRVVSPLDELWKGTEEIRRGNLDFQMRVGGNDDIARLGERFNEMAQRLKESYADLEQKLYDRTRELAALDAVSLTLAQAGNLKEMLGKSLAQIFGSLAGLELRGGIFLCDPAGQTLNLMVHEGLSPEFTQREENIRMGECLCGRAAETGEIFYSDAACEVAEHTRAGIEEPHGHIIIPIKSRGIVLGVIFLYPRHDFTLKPSDLQMLDAIGVQLGMAVENFRFYAEVKDSSEKFWDLFENSRDILFTTDAGGNVTAANRETERFLGYSKVELFGRSVLEFLAPEDADRAKELLAGKGKSGSPWIEFEVIKRDGSRAFLEVSARQIVKGREPAGFQVSARDITERKHLRELLVKAERLGAIGQVGVAVRHEINNPLTTVIGNIELLIERYEDKDPELRARLETVLSNALRIGEIVKRLEGIKQEKVVEYLKGVKMTDLQ